jgi:hypothetical protein
VGVVLLKIRNTGRKTIAVSVKAAAETEYRVLRETFESDTSV